MLGLFTALINIQDDVEDGSNKRVRNHMGCAMIDCTEKNEGPFFRKSNFFVFVLVTIYINPCTTFQTTFGGIRWYYSLKKSYFGQTFCQNNEEINARLYWMIDITKIFVTECLLKVQKKVNEYDQEIPKSQTADNPMAPWGQTFFESICGKMFSWKVVYGWMDTITKKTENTIYLCSAVYQHKKT